VVDVRRKALYPSPPKKRLSSLSIHSKAVNE